MNKLLLGCLSAVIFICASASAQNFKQEISLSGFGDPNATAKPFGIAFNPSNNLLYVSIAGSFGANNNVVAVINPTNDAVVSTIFVGLFPEDIAFNPMTGGGAVTNSTSGTVTFFNIYNTVSSTLQLPDPFGIGSCYPFSITYANGYYFVGTVDGSGEVYAIDATTNLLTPSMGFSTNYKSIGRMASMNPADLLVTTTEYNFSWSGSTGGLLSHSINGNNADRQVNYFSQDNVGVFPSASDLSLANGKIFMTGIDFDGKLYIVNQDGTPARAIDAHGHNGYGLATSFDNSLVVMCELATGTVVFFDAENEEYFSEVSFAGMANDAAFALNKLYVTDQANERVMVYDQLPSFVNRNEHDGTLVINNSAPSLGDQIGITLSGNVGKPVWLVGGSTSTATFHNGIEFAIGPTLSLYGSGNTTYFMGRTVPTNSALSGRHFYVQGAVSDGSVIRTTLPAVLIIQ
jgi:DNA-binding beta-propeller fold protein YncE